jgi:hypothetical protein
MWLRQRVNDAGQWLMLPSVPSVAGSSLSDLLLGGTVSKQRYRCAVALKPSGHERKKMRAFCPHLEL